MLTLRESACTWLASTRMVRCRCRQRVREIVLSSGWAVRGRQMFDFHGSGRLSRRLRVSLGVFWGRWCLPLPCKTDIIGLVGPPIPVIQVPITEPSSEPSTGHTLGP